MPGKRKASAPTKADEAKRKQLSWNLTEQFQNNAGGSDLIDDGELDAEPTSSAQKTSWKSSNIRDGIGSVEYAGQEWLDLINECDYYLEITSSAPELEWYAKIGSFNLHIAGEALYMDQHNFSEHEIFNNTITSDSSNKGTSSEQSACDIYSNDRQFQNLFTRVPLAWLYVNSTTCQHILYFEFPNKNSEKSDAGEGSSKNGSCTRKSRNSNDKSAAYTTPAVRFFVECKLPLECLESLKQKDYKIMYQSVNVIDGQTVIYLNICLLDSGLTNVSRGWETFLAKRKQSALQKLMQWFHGYSQTQYCEETYTRDSDIIALYDDVRRRHTQTSGLEVRRLDVQHEALRPRLRQYQREAVMWMLAQENYWKKSTLSKNDGLHSLYTEVILECFLPTEDKLQSEIFYYNHWAGILTRMRPMVVHQTPGGILAEEMGLGKTVEVLACVLLHPRPNLPSVEALPVVQSVTEVSGETRNSKFKVRRSKSVVDKPEKQSIRRAGSVRTKSNSTYQHSLSSESADSQSSKISEGSKSLNNIGGIVLSATSNNLIADLDSDHSLINLAKSSLASTDVPPASFSSNIPVVGSNSDVELVSDTITIPSSSLSNIPTASDHAYSSADLSESMQAVLANNIPVMENKDIKETQTDSNTLAIVCDDSVTVAAFYECGTSSISVKSPGSDSTCTIDYSMVEDSLSNEASSVDGGRTIQMDADSAAPIECVCGEIGAQIHSDGHRGRQTVTLVSCVLCHARLHAGCVNYDLTDPYRGQFYCPHCHVANSCIESGATLIVTPSSISEQWVEEILKHINRDGIQLFVYTGVHKQGFIQPSTLARQDIVLTTYETLRKEIDYVDLPHKNNNNGRKLRHPKRFMAIPSPIVCVQWWRICLDEAQMVETTTTKTAEMALRLSAVNRWCVTGTPIQRSIEDLYGLFLFLNVDPYFVKTWWTRLLQEPYYHGHEEPLRNALTNVFWRTAKKDVIDQLGLPDQTVVVHWLTFSPVEQQFYQRQYEECAREGRQRLSKLTDRELKLKSLDKYTLHQLLQPLRRLRQACCHPQAVRGSFLPLHRCAMTMDELLKEMLRRVKYECEEARREIVFAHNGLAGLHILEKNYVEAVEEYRNVLRSAEEHKDLVRTDDLQLLHTITNLSEILQLSPPGVGVTLRDSDLKKQEQEIRDRYTQRVASFVTTAKETWLPLNETVTELKQQVEERNGWWAELIQWTIKAGLDNELVDHVKADLTNNLDFSSQKFSISRSFRNARGLEYILTDKIDELDRGYEELIPKLRNLDKTPSRQLIETTVECCLRPTVQTNNRCEFCLVHDLLEAFESKLYMFIDKGVSHEPDLEGEGSAGGGLQVSTKRKGTWADSETEKILKSICNFVSKYSARFHREVLENGQIHLKLFEALKKEFKPLRSVWVALKEQVGALDELSMATTRLRLREPHEVLADPTQANIVEPSLMEQKRMKFVSDRIVGETQLKRKKSQYLYLQNLSTAQSDLSEGLNPELCPICRQQLGKKWTVLQCGHCYCITCIRVMVDSYSFGGGAFRSLRCAVCRCRTRHADISYVSMRRRIKPGSDDNTKDASEDDFIVKGDHSTKIEGVVRCLMKILAKDSSAKILVFSTWQDVLDALGGALKDNNISYRSLGAHNKFDVNLHEFKHSSEVSVLLLPVHSGANGLNLIEARHVILVEPILNIAQELQAIGRVHRIGQTQPTTVHRFMVRGTIEEYIHSLLQSSSHVPLETRNSEETTLTIGDLHDLFHMTPVIGDEEEEEDNSVDISGNGNDDGGSSSS